MTDWSIYAWISSSKLGIKIINLLDNSIYPLSSNDISNKLDRSTSQICAYIRELLDKGLIKNLTPEIHRGAVYELAESGKEIAKILKSKDVMGQKEEN